MIACTQCNLINFFCKFTVRFTPKPLLRFQYSFILLQVRLVVLNFNFVFYYTLLYTFCFFVNTAIICQVTSLVSTPKSLSLFFQLIHPSTNSSFISSITFLFFPVNNSHILMYQILSQHLLQGLHKHLQN